MKREFTFEGLASEFDGKGEDLLKPAV